MEETRLRSRDAALLSRGGPARADAAEMMQLLIPEVEIYGKDTEISGNVW